ncbi:Ig-like domain-containing protein [Enterococcus sp. BWT-B8]|uniref:Ig-like domain-containing protein n=1 Tax=Enterococcus sp. BWT-B8 TaxID=2885157 RepID=UPI001E5AF224|nr:Ig-like domain-containing protein [Enterococcus sp. BWT-B8]MCB5951801.1 Ig-like domain-containing protein [Enterococcus sp. BWT-B8]
MSYRRKMFLALMFGLVLWFFSLPISVFASVDNGVFISNEMTEKEYPETLEGTLLNAIDGYTSVRTRGIIGEDNRDLVGNTEVYPYSAIVQLSVIFPDGVSVLGTGSMISGDTVLTAAHCLYNESRGGWASSVIVMPGRQEWTLPFGRYTADEFYVLSSYLQPGNGLNSDIGLIKLKEDIGEKTGWLGMSSESLNENNYTLTGYPGDLGKYYMYTEERLIPSSDWTTEFYVHHSHDAYSGQSGAPLYETANKRIVAVHSGSNSTTNFATRLTRKRVVAIYDIAFPQKTAVTGIVLTPETMLMEKGETLQLTTSISPETATNKKVIWQSSDDNLATVTDTGKVLAKSAGIVTVTVTTEDNQYTAACTITIDDHSNNKEFATDISSTDKIDGVIQSNKDVDYFMYKPKHSGTYRFRTPQETLVEPYIKDESGNKPFYYTGPWAGACFYLEDNKTYFFEISNSVTGQTGAYSYRIEDPFDDPHVQTFPTNVPKSTITWMGSATSFSKDKMIPAVKYNLYQAPSAGLVRVESWAKDEISKMTVLVEVYNEKKEKIAVTTIENGTHKGSFEVSEGQKFYLKLINETPELRESYKYRVGYKQLF